MTYTVLVCGGRDYDDMDKVANTLNQLCDKLSLWGEEDAFGEKVADIRIVTGAARGADECAAQWAELYASEQKHYPANWKKYGLGAGGVRNQEMLEKEKVDLVIAFPGGPGTRDMCMRAAKAGVKLQHVK